MIYIQLTSSLFRHEWNKVIEFSPSKDSSITDTFDVCLAILYHPQTAGFMCALQYSPNLVKQQKKIQEFFSGGGIRVTKQRGLSGIPQVSVLIFSTFMIKMMQSGAACRIGNPFPSRIPSKIFSYSEFNIKT